MLGSEIMDLMDMQPIETPTAAVKRVFYITLPPILGSTTCSSRRGSFHLLEEKRVKKMLSCNLDTS